MKVAITLKEYILINYDQITLFAKYLNISYLDVLNATTYSTYINNPLRVDVHPSLTFGFNRDNKLRMYDNAIRIFRFDIFDLVGYLFDKNTGNASDFVDICKIIIDESDISKKKPIIIKQFDDAYRIIVPTTREWWKSDRIFWEHIGVSMEHLYNRNVFPMIHAHIDGQVTYYDTAYGAKYCYFLGVHKYTPLYKIYAPGFRIRFRTNNKFKLEAPQELYSANTLIITKSRKDKLAIECLLDNGYIDYALRRNKTLNNSAYCVTNLSGESVRLSSDTIKWLKSNYTNIILNLDYDYTGLEAGFYYKFGYDIDTVYLGGDSTKIKGLDVKEFPKNLVTLIRRINTEFNIDLSIDDFYEYAELKSGKYVDKDVTDYTKANGVTQGMLLVNNLFKC